MSSVYYAYGPAPLRRRAGVVRFKKVFEVLSFVRMVVLYFLGLVFYVRVLFVQFLLRPLVARLSSCRF